MTTLEATLIGVLIAALVAGLLGLARYLVTTGAEAKRWQREQQAKEIDLIDSAATTITERAAQLTSGTHSLDAKEHRQEVGELRSGFARWEMLVYPYCTVEERKRIQEIRNDLFEKGGAFYQVMQSATRATIEITHAVKERITKGRRPWWRFWGD